MNSFPEDDSSLKSFLQQNRPTVPSASTDLEDRILALVETTPQQITIAEPPRNKTHIRRSIYWLAPSAIAAGLIAAVIGYRSSMPSQPSETELAELQTFIESTWQGTVAESPTAEELYTLTDEASLN